MTSDKMKGREKLLQAACGIFKDVVTGGPARTEEELSALLALFHNWGRIDWSKVQLEVVGPTRVSGQVPANSLGISGYTAVSEYPLFAAPGSDEMRRWGKFRADILLVSKSSLDRLIYVESKIDASIRPDLIPGVLRYLEQQPRFTSCAFVILRGRGFSPEWYRKELLSALAEPDLKLEKTKTYFMYWEDVFAACAAP